MEMCAPNNQENVSAIYNTELLEHLEDLKELGATLAEDAANYRVKSK